MALVCKGAGFLDVREIDPGPVTATNSLGRKIQQTADANKAYLS